MTGESGFPTGSRSAGDMARRFVGSLPVTGASVSTLGVLLGTQTVAASDPLAARLDEIQFDLGEGPCWDAVRLRRPILLPDLRNDRGRSWPIFAQAVLSEGVGALFAFPLLVGPLEIGAVDMYSRLPLTLETSQTEKAADLADATARQILRGALDGARGHGDDYREDDRPYSRKIVHQATGMVLAQLGISADDARMVIQAHAFTSDRSMMEVARDVLDRRIDFSALDEDGRNTS